MIDKHNIYTKKYCSHVPTNGRRFLQLLHTDYDADIISVTHCAYCGKLIQPPTAYYHTLLKLFYVFFAAITSFLILKLATSIALCWSINAVLITIPAVALFFLIVFIFDKVTSSIVFSTYRWCDYDTASCVLEDYVVTAKIHGKYRRNRKSLRTAITRGYSIATLLFIGFPVALYATIDTFCAFFKLLPTGKRKMAWIIVLGLVGAFVLILSVYNPATMIFCNCLSILIVLVVVVLESNI